MANVLKGILARRGITEVVGHSLLRRLDQGKPLAPAYRSTAQAFIEYPETRRDTSELSSLPGLGCAPSVDNLGLRGLGLWARREKIGFLLGWAGHEP